jgi:hypothetical protein
VLINDALVFSKKKTGRFPLEGEVEAMFEALRDGKELPPTVNAPGPSGFVNRIIDRLRS